MKKRYFIEIIDGEIGSHPRYIYVYFMGELRYFSTFHKFKYRSEIDIGCMERSENFTEVSESYINKLLVELELSK